MENSNRSCGFLVWIVFSFDSVCHLMTAQVVKSTENDGEVIAVVHEVSKVLLNPTMLSARCLIQHGINQLCWNLFTETTVPIGGTVKQLILSTSSFGSDW
jgi:hypothetical protein